MADFTDIIAGVNLPPSNQTPRGVIADALPSAGDFLRQIPEFGRGRDLGIQPLDAGFTGGLTGAIAGFGEEQTLRNIQQSFGVARELAPQLTADRLGQFQSVLSSVSPQAAAIQQARDEAILDFLGGEIPDDVAAEIARVTAEQSGRAGIGIASGRARNIQARDLGLTSLDLINRGVTSALQVLPQERALAGSLSVDPLALGGGFLNLFQGATVTPPSTIVGAATTAAVAEQDIAFAQAVAEQQAALSALELSFGAEQAALTRASSRDIAELGQQSLLQQSAGQFTGGILGTLGTSLGGFIGGLF